MCVRVWSSLVGDLWVCVYECVNNFRDRSVLGIIVLGIIVCVHTILIRRLISVGLDGLRDS